MSARSGLICLILFLLLIFPLSAFSWDGIDYDTGNDVDIDDSDMPSISPGAIIKIFDYNDSNYHNVEVMSVVKTLDTIKIGVFDKDTNKYRIFEMDGLRIGWS